MSDKKKISDQVLDQNDDMKSTDTNEKLQNPIKKKVQKTKRLISLKEYLIGKDFSRGYIAGFKMYLKTDRDSIEFATSQGWKELLTQYDNRQLGR